ncbi:YpiB family protein [Facklamia miroungae]|uniref:Uncharacterized protein YpiB, UPF0302 family n=1 Tax=Facklamia miroungae TaxID=120956 RepID=A0A1G7PKD6_9LACT|nr:YpiB family protein [Facklamia miroungae]NKZ28750.1 hypothetical protein [Facklamia miroungae]SDF86832.1 Uncharacterized protein YpiB, UPF0302 family [Facklamia miroungae]
MNELQEKHQFLNWIIFNHPHPNREIMIFLAYLQMKHDELQWLEFSHDVIYAPRGIKISYQTSLNQPLIYYKGHYIYHRIDQAFHDFRLNSLKKEQSFYFEFDFPDFEVEAMRRGILKDNPFTPVTLKVIDQVNYELDHLSRKVYKKLIMEKIDSALENHNFDLINQWIDQYRSGLE